MLCSPIRYFILFMWVLCWRCSYAIEYDEVQESPQQQQQQQYKHQQPQQQKQQRRQSSSSNQRQTIHQLKTNPHLQQQQSVVRNELYEAAFVGDVDRVANLLRLDTEILSSRAPVLLDRRDADEGRTALMVCGFDPQFANRTKVDVDCTNIAQLLFNAGANMTMEDNHGWDALALAAVRGYSRLCKFLLKQVKVDPNHVDYDQVTALMKGAGHAHFGVVNVLLKYGADLTLRDGNGLTALHYATRLAMRNESYVPFLEKMLRLIKPNVVDSLVDFNNRTCLMYAAIDNNVGICKLLIEAGSDPRLQDSYYVSIPSMTNDPTLKEKLLEEIALRVEEDHSAWISNNQFDFESVELVP